MALTALEFLVAALQAYVFAILTCLYLNDALHPGPLKTNLQRKKATRQWKRKQQSSSAPASPASAWAAPASASATSSATTSPRAIRNPAAAPGQFTNLIFGFAVTEALGIFSFLIALLLLFAL